MNLRNIAIIAHVDHGKTTLVDELLKQAGSFRETSASQSAPWTPPIWKSERGITILAKATSVDWKDYRIKHRRYPRPRRFRRWGVERILSMVDSAIVLVDAAEGPDAADQVRGRARPSRSA